MLTHRPGELASRRSTCTESLTSVRRRLPAIAYATLRPTTTASLACSPAASVPGDATNTPTAQSPLLPGIPIGASDIELPCEESPYCYNGGRVSSALGAHAVRLLSSLTDDDNGDDNYASLRAYDINDQPRHPSPPPSSHAHGTTLHDGIANYHRPLTTAKTTATPPAAPGRPYSTLSPPAAAAIVGEPVLAETTTTSWPLRQPA